MKYIAFTVVLVMLFLSACETVVINRGYEMATADFDKIVLRKDTAKDVFQKFGSPTVRSSFVSAAGGYAWYYVYKKFAKSGFLKARMIEQKTIAITFDANDFVVSVVHGQAEKNVASVSDRTKDAGKKYGIRQALKETNKYVGMGKMSVKT